MPMEAAAAVGSVHHTALHGAVPFDPGRHYPHGFIAFTRPGRLGLVRLAGTAEPSTGQHSASGRLMGDLVAETMAGCCLMWPDACRRWLPVWLHGFVEGGSADAVWFDQGRTHDRYCAGCPGPGAEQLPCHRGTRRVGASGGSTPYSCSAPMTGQRRPSVCLSRG